MEDGGLNSALLPPSLTPRSYISREDENPTHVSPFPFRESLPRRPFLPSSCWTSKLTGPERDPGRLPFIPKCGGCFRVQTYVPLFFFPILGYE